jgi:hypothetical protein
MLTLTPIAALGQIVGDHAAFVIGNVVFAVLGGASAALVFGIGSRAGLSRRAAGLGGLFYAVWLGAIAPEVSARLEPLGNFALLAGLYCVTGKRSSRSLLAGGAALGFAVGVKIWWIVPVLVVVIWKLVCGPRRAAAVVGAGALGALLVVCGPFFCLAPGSMWRMVVIDQLQRNATTSSRLGRLADLSSVRALKTLLPLPAQVALLLVVAALVGKVVLTAWRVELGRFAVSLAAAELIVLMLAPTYFGYYSGFAATGTALVVGCAAAGRRTRLRRDPAALMIATSALITVTVLVSGSVSVSKPFPSRLAARVSGIRCLVADSPMALIETNTLSRGLSLGCPNWVDVTGRTYDVDAPGAHFVVRPRNQRWQRDVRRYLLSGSAFILIRHATGLSTATRLQLSRQPVLVRSRNVVVRLGRGSQVTPAG